MNLEKMVKFWKNKFEKLKVDVKQGIEEELLKTDEHEKLIL